MYHIFTLILYFNGNRSLFYSSPSAGESISLAHTVSSNVAKAFGMMVALYSGGDSSKLPPVPAGENAKGNGMLPDAVLVLGSDGSRELTEALLETGFTPLVRGTVQELLDKLRHGRFAAVLVDRDSVDVDVLELFLNIRDINDHIPVVAVGQTSGDRSEQALLSLPGAIVIGRTVAPDQLIKALEKVVSSEEVSNG